MTMKVWAWFIKYLFLGVVWLQAPYSYSACGSHHSSIPSWGCAPNSRVVGRRADLAGRMHGCSLSSGLSTKSPSWIRPGLHGWEGVMGQENLCVPYSAGNRAAPAHVSHWATCLRQVVVQSHPSLPMM